MSRIFLSHSSANNAEAIAVRDWLVEHGWDDVFLDLDPERGLKAGQRWQDALKQAAERCELVIFLVSPAWRASEWCVAEFLLAKQMNKRIVGVIVDPIPLKDLPTEMTAEWQLVDLKAGDRDYERTISLPPGDTTATVAFGQDGLDRLRIGLSDAGLDPKYFEWPPKHDPDRAPYRGLKPLDGDDAGIFFGRDGPIVIGMDMLRGLREAAPPRLVVILGASGAGKSSFMRAGLLPRLAREDQHFLPLPVIRPERAVMTGETGLIASLEQACKAAGRPRTRAELRTAIDEGTSGVAAVLAELVQAKSRPAAIGNGDGTRKPPTVILPIDQAEELFTSEGAEEAQPFLRLLHDLAVADAPAVIALFTIRSDSYEVLQTAAELKGLRQQMLSLPPMPQGAYAEVIKGPARRLDGTAHALVVEEQLVDALLSDVEDGGGKDAIPLLAFTLERLYRKYGGDGDLKLSEYNELGRVAGSIEAAVERALQAADDNPKIPRDRKARLALLRRALIPWLAGLDPETGTPRRRIARMTEIPDEARPLVELLVDERLLATDTDSKSGKTTVEPAHEALLRKWGLLEGWLQEDAGQLSVIGGVKRATRDWLANGKRKPWLVHNSSNLMAAERLQRRPDLAQVLDDGDWRYVKACRGKVRRGQVWSGMFASFVAAIVAGGAVLASQGKLDRVYLEENIIGPIRLQPILWDVTPTALTDSEERALKSGSRFQECPSCPEMVVIPSGKFMMGSAEGEEDDNERPQHDVTISKPFAVSKFEVTFDQWEACVAHGGCQHKPADEFWGRGNRPVINITYKDIKEQYLPWLNQITGKTYRLLSEAEWEYTARAKTTTAYSWGKDVGKGNANCRICGSQWDGKQTAPVGSFKANAFGLHDMHGNVYEWVQDCWHESYTGAPSDGKAWTSGECSGRVLRGGSWNYLPQNLRSAVRLGHDPDIRVDSIGFRVGRTLTP